MAKKTKRTTKKAPLKKKATAKRKAAVKSKNASQIRHVGPRLVVPVADSSLEDISAEAPVYTGRLIASAMGFDGQEVESKIGLLRRKSGLRSICRSGDFKGAMDVGQAHEADVVLFQEFGIAVLNATEEEYDSIRSASRSAGMQLENERWNYEMGFHSEAHLPSAEAASQSLRRSDKEVSVEYLRGYHEALSLLLDKLDSKEELEPANELPQRDGVAGDVGAANFFDSRVATWGLQATGVTGSAFTGAGVKVAVLDTGFDSFHQDFRNRSITSESFIPPSIANDFGQVINLTDRSATIDQSGHGTHCIGTACGAQVPPSGTRYGIAHGSQIFNGKVLSKIPGMTRAAGADGWILDGIRWAINEGCSIISLSLGSEVARGEGFLSCYEDVAKVALKNGVLIIAAAGNESRRNLGIIRPVGSPANCPSIAAVGAVDQFVNQQGRHGIAHFSNRHFNDQGGEVNFCGPGVGILSSSPGGTSFLDGTSQATPHVSGIAALVQEETGKRGRDLLSELFNRAIPQAPHRVDVDYGIGLVHV